MTDEVIEDLQIRIEHQELAIEQLNETVASQGRCSSINCATRSSACVQRLLRVASFAAGAGRCDEPPRRIIDEPLDDLLAVLALSSKALLFRSHRNPMTGAIRPACEGTISAWVGCARNHAPYLLSSIGVDDGHGDW
jgi:uncharacterized coiled-coil protein SlyX